MASVTGKYRTAFLLLFFLLNPMQSYSLPFYDYRNLLSLSHLLTSRVANLRASRGDSVGAARAQAIAQKLDSFTGLGFLKLSWTMGWDYFRHYAWADINTFSFNSISSAVSDLNELIRALDELTRVNSNIERVAWVSRNYKKVQSISISLFGKLLKKFSQPGPLREFVETMRKEVMEGDFLRDCLELSTSDLKGLIQVIKDITLQYAGSRNSRAEL